MLEFLNDSHSPSFAFLGLIQPYYGKELKALQKRCKFKDSERDGEEYAKYWSPLVLKNDPLKSNELRKIHADVDSDFESGYVEIWASLRRKQTWVERGDPLQWCLLNKKIPVFWEQGSYQILSISIVNYFFVLIVRNEPP